jgi:NTP pyrophosphatase (non-canonical NTP hydrolase)
MSKKDVERISLVEWAERFAQVNPGDWKGLGSASAWLRFVEHATAIAEEVRSEEYDKLIRDLGYTFGWLCCFVNYYTKEQPNERFKFLSPLPDMVWAKYPGVCYRCTHKFKEEQLAEESYLACCCLAVPSVSEDEKSIIRGCLEIATKSKRKPVTIDEWAYMIKAIYGPNHRELSLSKICLHFLEEVGEVAKGLRELQRLSTMEDPEKRKEKIAELEDEIADVFSWTFGLLNKLDQIMEKAREHFRSVVKIELPAIEASDVVYNALERWKEKTIP